MGKRILIAEDDNMTRRLLVEGLRLRGHLVIEARDGIEALSSLDGQPLDIIITDLHMPRMNGIELTKEIRCNIKYMKVPILVLSSETDQEKKEVAVNSNITGWIKKPINMEKLQALIDRATRSRNE
jgi:two-component system, chemotaxis family, chemotaxis protein CheY